jgi:hypothetical protein
LTIGRSNGSQGRSVGATDPALVGQNPSLTIEFKDSV